MDWENTFQKIVWFVILPFSCISFCLTALTNDTRIFLGSAAIADNYYPPPYGWDAAYEVKPIGNRILNWILYKVANAIVPFVSNNYFWFGVVIKACALVILLVCCWYISKRLMNGNPYAFPLLVLAFACQANFGIMMAEWFAVLFSLVTVALFFEKNKNWIVIAGMLFVCIALLKGITLLLTIPSLCAVYLFGGSVDWKRLLFGFASASIVFLILCSTVWPYQIMDILLSGKIAHVGNYGINTLLSYLWITNTGMVLPAFLVTYIPIIACGILVAIPVALSYIGKKNHTAIILFVFMWLVPFLIILIQSEFIGYHYLVLMLPAIVSIILFIRKWQKFTRITFVGIISFLAITFLIINSFFGTYSIYEYNFWGEKEKNANNITEKYGLQNQSEILYLDPGDAAYYFHANSSCRYIAPMPVQRNNPPEWDLRKWPQYSDNRKCILQYQGKYIITDVSPGSLFSYRFFTDPDIAATISSNYTKVDSESWDIFQKRVTEVPGISDARGGTSDYTPASGE